MHTLSILKRFSFSFLLVFFFFFFCILDFKSQNNEKCQRVLRSILVLCVVWMFKFAWLHDIIREKILIFLFKNSCRLIIQSGEVYIYLYINIMRGKKDATTFPGNVVASFFPLIIFILLCFNVLSTVPRENRLADFLYLYIYIYLYRYISRASLEVYCVFLLAFFLGWKHL